MGCAQTRAWISVVFFYPIPNKFGVNIVEWPMFNANVLDFWYVFALSNYGANSCELARKMVQILGFSAPVRFRGTSKKIGIAKVLLETKPRSVEVGKFRGCRFCDFWESVARKKKKRSADYNGSLALATLEPATITIYGRIAAVVPQTCRHGL